MSTVVKDNPIAAISKGCFSINMFVFLRVAETEPKEGARVPRPLRGCPARRRCGRSTRKLAPPSPGLRRSSDRSACFYPTPSPMLGAAQWEIKSQSSFCLFLGRLFKLRICEEKHWLSWQEVDDIERDAP
jgi:hypothetical protein